MLTNGEPCYELYGAQGLLPDVVAALREYREVLALEQQAALAFTPRDVQSPCDLANHVYAPARHLAHGFPVRLVEPRGRERRVTELTDYKTDFVADARLFELPASFPRMNLRELQTR